MFYSLLDAQQRADCMSDGNLSSRAGGGRQLAELLNRDTHTAARRRQQFIGERLILPVSCMLFHSAERSSEITELRNRSGWACEYRER
jgi:hypothetical protein